MVLDLDTKFVRVLQNACQKKYQALLNESKRSLFCFLEVKLTLSVHPVATFCVSVQLINLHCFQED